MSWRGAEAKRRVTAGGNAGLTKAAKHLETEAEKIVPELTGDTKKSGDSGLLHDGMAAVVFTDSKAIAVHEDLRHRHRPGKSAKYLEKPLHTERPKLLEMIAEGLRSEFH